MKFRISKTWIVIIIIILLIVGYYVVKSALKSPTEGFVVEKVQKGEVLQEVSETGSVKAAEDLSLGFKTIGKVSRLYVAVGDKVNRGDVLAELDSGQLVAQLQSAKASLEYTTSQHSSSVASAKDNLQSTYNSALNTLNDSYTKIYNAYNIVVDLQNNYFSSADQPGIVVQQNRDDILEKMQAVKTNLDKATASKFQSDIDSAVSQTLSSLKNVFEDLRLIRIQCDSDAYYSKVSSTYKTSIDTQKTNINTAIANVTAAQTSISSYKIALQKAQESQVEEAQADVDALQSQLNDTRLVSPINGVITEVNIKRGQVVSASQSVINLLSSEPFEIKVNIYEQDIVNVELGDSVKIELVPLPKQIFEGKVLSIDPAETIVDNVVYYQVTIEFPKQPESVKSGMTADIIIQTNKKENVLRVPKNAVYHIGGRDAVQIFADGKIQDRQITTGLEGSDYFEVLSGLNEGEEIIIGKK